MPVFANSVNVKTYLSVRKSNTVALTKTCTLFVTTLTELQPAPVPVVVFPPRGLSLLPCTLTLDNISSYLVFIIVASLLNFSARNFIDIHSDYLATYKQVEDVFLGGLGWAVQHSAIDTKNIKTQRIWWVQNCMNPNFPCMLLSLPCGIFFWMHCPPRSGLNFQRFVILKVT